MREGGREGGCGECEGWVSRETRREETEGEREGGGEGGREGVPPQWPRGVRRRLC